MSPMMSCIVEWNKRVWMPVRLLHHHWDTNQSAASVQSKEKVALMAGTLPFVHFITLPGSTEPDALLGFSLPFLPDMLTSHWLTGSNQRERLHEALRLQVRLVNALW